jgi:hypothetical protein
MLRAGGSAETESSAMKEAADRRWRVIGILLVAAAIACSWLPWIQNLANAQVDDGLKRALFAFAAAKALNAAISVVQGTEVNVQMLGGVTLTPGQWLDPINDLVEQFASLMLAASVAFGVQKVLLAIGAHWLISAAVTVFAVAWAHMWWYGRAPSWLTRVLVVLLTIRFAFPIVTIGSEAVFRHFLTPQYAEATQSIAIVTAKVDEPAPAGKGKGWFDRLREVFSSASTIGDQVGELKRAADEISDQIVRLIVVFVVQTIVVPTVLLWSLLKLAGGAWRARP